MTTDSLGPACRAARDLWNDVVEEYLAGGGVLPHLEPWAKSYQGRGEGAVEWGALPELFLGPLTGKPRGVFLALNPGRADLRFHGRDGIFAKEIGEEYGGAYSAWAASWPYFRDPWVAGQPEPNRHHTRRLRFLRDWCGDQELPASAMLAFELYPWHSPRFTGRLSTEAAHDFIRKYIWETIAELGAPVFAFGAPWFSILNSLGLEVVEQLGSGGRPYGSGVKSRAVRVLRGQGVTVVAEKHDGEAGPPSPTETIRLREALDR